MTVVVTPLSGSEKLCLREVFTSAWASGLLPRYIHTCVFVIFSSPHGHREIVTEGHTSELWDFTRISAAQNELQKLKDIWAHWDDETKQLFYHNYGDSPYLLDVKVDKHLFRAMAQFWNPAYNCFTFGKVDLVPTMEEHTTLLRCPRI
ncbi:Nucleoside-triphosphatase THEP1 [Gossypium australe]|uniref:Nucleoside-triphosphatase THEP1 n=1 Tax=Gossypium australe TaxID=47621 RepID=A0A5B6X4N2_9ROSI|nr:Nucleoside-triphosphatase THEP1 [Gossypium australe]